MQKPDEPFLSLIGCISEYFLFRMLLRLDISSYILILATVTTTYKPSGQETTLMYTKQRVQDSWWWCIDPGGNLNHVYRKILRSRNRRWTTSMNMWIAWKGRKQWCMWDIEFTLQNTGDKLLYRSLIYSLFCSYLSKPLTHKERT